MLIKTFEHYKIILVELQNFEEICWLGKTSSAIFEKLWTNFREIKKKIENI